MESTPLLHSSPPADTGNETGSLPHIHPTLARVRTLDTNHIRSEDLCPVAFPSQSTETAFALVVLLKLRQDTLRLKTPSSDSYEQWSQKKTSKNEVSVLEEQIVSLWAHFLLEYRSPRDLETVLWTKFMVQEGSAKTLRVVDLLLDSDAPEGILCHPITVSSLSEMWKRGHLVPSASERGSRFQLARRYDATYTPRAAHLVDLLSQLIYLVLLIHYLLYPPMVSITTVPNRLVYLGAREWLLIIFPISFITSDFQSSLNPGFFLTLLAFFVRLPCVPLPGDTSFSVLFLGLIVRILQLHLPSTPSPLLLFSPERSIPPSILLIRGLRQIIYPAILFFFPVFILTTFLLSLSMADTFLSYDKSTNLAPIPIQARAAFLLLFLIVLMLQAFSLVIFATNQMLTETESHGWDLYSKNIGRDARLAFARAVVAYAEPYRFPPPLNLVQLLVIRVPSIAMRFMGIRVAILEKAERILWRVIAGPFIVIVSIFFRRS